MAASDPRELQPAGRLHWVELLRFLGFALLIATALGLALAFQSHINVTSSGRAMPWGQTLRFSLARYWITGVLSLPVLWMARRHPLTSAQRWRSLVTYLLGFLPYSVSYVLLRLVFLPPIDVTTYKPIGRSLESGLNLLRSNAFDQFWMYLTTLAIVLTIQYYQESRRRELREAELKSQVSEYELQILKLQLHPHFLFNTLNGISVLMTQDVKTAREMMLRLSDLLRIALAHTSAKEVSLREEMDFIDAYLQIEQMRFGPRLRVSMQIDPATLDASVPNMILQPLVENAVRHGIGASRAGGEVGIQAERERDILRITVSNDGTGLRPEPARRSGLGLGNTRARLLQLYGTAYNLRMAERESGRVEVCLEIPFHEVEMPAHV